jgi:hypothetical protein
VSAPSFELLRLVALPAGADVAVVELEGRLRPAAQRSGTTPRALKPRLLLEDEAGRMDIPAATHELEGRVLRAAFAVPTARLAGAELAIGVRDVLFDLPAPDTIPGAEREIALAREANALRRELAAARAELAEAEEAREAAVAEARREGEERLAAAEVLIARERDEAATREAALTEQLEAEGREAAAREEELRREAEAREEAARVEGAGAHAAARQEFDAQVADLQAELEAARREVDARELHVRQEALAQMQQLRADADARVEQARAGQAAAERAAAERAAAERAAAERAEVERAAAERAAPTQAGADEATVELGAVPVPQDVDLGPPGPAAAPEPDPPTIRPSTAAGRAEPPRSRGGAGDRADDAIWQEPAGTRAGGLFDEPYDSHPGSAGGAAGGSVLADPDDLDDDEDATAPQPLRRVRRTGEPVPPRSQPATQVRPRGPAASRPEEPAVGEASVLRYIALGFVVLTLLLVILAIAAL